MKWTVKVYGLYALDEMDVEILFVGEFVMKWKVNLY